MSKNKELADYIMDQLSDLGNVRNIPMMGFFFKLTLLAPTKRKVIASLKVGDFSEGYNSVTVNGFEIKLPRALSLDIKNELAQINRDIQKDDLFFKLFFGCKYSENLFNTVVSGCFYKFVSVW